MSDNNELHKNMVSDERKFNLRAATDLSLKKIGVPFFRIGELAVGELYSPSRPVEMTLAGDGDGKHTVKPCDIVQFQKSDTGYEFLSSDLILYFSATTGQEDEPLLFCRAQEFEMGPEFSIYDVIGADRVTEAIKSSHEGKTYKTPAAAKSEYVETIKRVLDPLVKHGLMVGYKVIDENEKQITLHCNSISRGSYTQLTFDI